MNQFGGMGENEGNVISDNAEDGISIKDKGGTTIAGNIIGLSALGDTARGYSQKAVTKPKDCPDKG